MSRVLVFEHGDGPAASVPTTFDDSTLTLRVTTNRPATAPMWVGTKQRDGGAVALLKNDGRVETAQEVIVMRRVVSTAVDPAKFNASDAMVQDLDIRTAAGKKLDNQRREYGTTYSRAAAKPAMMDAEENYDKRQQKAKRERARLEDELGNTAGGTPQDSAGGATPVAAPAGRGRKANRAEKDAAAADSAAKPHKSKPKK